MKRRQINFWLIELTKKFMFMLQISVHKPQQPNRTSIAPKSTMKVINNTCSMLALIFTIQFHASYKYSATTCLSWAREKKSKFISQMHNKLKYIDDRNKIFDLTHIWIFERVTHKPYSLHSKTFFSSLNKTFSHFAFVELFYAIQQAKNLFSNVRWKY